MLTSVPNSALELLGYVQRNVLEPSMIARCSAISASKKAKQPSQALPLSGLAGSSSMSCAHYSGCGFQCKRAGSSPSRQSVAQCTVCGLVHNTFNRCMQMIRAIPPTATLALASCTRLRRRRGVV